MKRIEDGSPGSQESTTGEDRLGRIVPILLQQAGKAARDRLEELISLVTSNSEGPSRGNSDPGPEAPSLRIMVYFDHAEHLALHHSQESDPEREGTTLFNIVTNALTHFIGKNVFFVFLSTNQYAPLLVPPLYAIPRGLPVRRYFKETVRPFFGGMIDYIPNKQPLWTELSLNKLGDLGYLSMFGRGL